MEGRIGSDLRRARTRREVSLREVEAATRIRTRFLVAIEAEDWDALPGGVYTRGFIRTYGSFLGLDGERLAEDYRREVEGTGGAHGPAHELAPVAASTATGSAGGRRSRAYLRWLAVPAILALAAAAILVFPSGENGGGGADRASAPPDRGGTGKAPASEPTTRPAPKPGVSLRLTTEAEVWVCLLDARGEALIEGQVLPPGERLGPFRSGSFTVAFGNGEVRMQVDSAQAEIPATSSPIGYAIDASGELTELEEAERPTCT